MSLPRCSPVTSEITHRGWHPKVSLSISGWSSSIPLTLLSRGSGWVSGSQEESVSNRENLQSLYQQLGITPEGTAIIEAIRIGEPVRAQTSGPQSSSGGFSSAKMGFVIGFESRTLEFAYLRGLECDKKVLEIYDQPYHLRLSVTRHDGQRCGYTHAPDFLVIAEAWIAFIEVKPTPELEEKATKQPDRFKQAKDGSWSSPAAEAALAGTGIQYRVITDRDINPILVRNLSFLSDFRRVA